MLLIINKNMYVVSYNILYTFSFKKRLQGFPGSSVLKNPFANAGDTYSMSGLGRSPG